MRTVALFRRMGVRIERKGGEWEVEGRRPRDLTRPPGILNCGNSGTTLRLMMGVFAALPFTVRLTGDASLNRRPVDRVIAPLAAMGARFGVRQRGGKRIVAIQGGHLRGIRYRLPVASAQVKSAILLAGRVAGVPVSVTEPSQSRDHTERMIRLFRRKIGRLEIPGDPSSAAFFAVAAAANPHRATRIRLQRVLVNPTRTGFLTVLKRMGARFHLSRLRDLSGEPVADLEIRSSPLRATRIGGSIVPKLIDEVPILAVAAAVAQGVSRFCNMGELRVKESDRIASLVSELKKFGVSIGERRDGVVISGGQPLCGAQVTSHGDHRIAMSLAVLGTLVPGRTTVKDIACVGTSFPGFSKAVRSVGVKIYLTS